VLTRDEYVRNLAVLDDYIAQLAPRVVRNVYTMNEGQPYIMDEGDKLRMRMDYDDVLEHDASTLRSIFGPLQAP
jgi:hypothetical protein